ncbi:MAG TPA: hypothetical protein VJB10_00960 [Candidatus Peribacteraceae bacterium]|nr:hypothetical protein [Candidatus Peribacteraceae bacterium]
MFFFVTVGIFHTATTLVAHTTAAAAHFADFLAARVALVHTGMRGKKDMRPLFSLEKSANAIGSEAGNARFSAFCCEIPAQEALLNRANYCII